MGNEIERRFWLDQELLKYNNVDKSVLSFVETQFPTAIGIILVGSVVQTGRESKSDYDFSIIYNDPELLRSTSPLFHESPYSHQELSEFDIFAIKTLYNQQKIGAQLISLEAIRRVCDYGGGYLRVLRYQGWDDYDKGKNAFGEIISVRPQTDLLPDGGVRIHLPITTEYKRMKYTGVHTHMFLANPLIIKDVVNIDEDLSRLWNNYLKYLLQFLPNLDIDSVLNSLWKGDQFNTYAIEYVSRQIQRFKNSYENLR